MSQPEDRNEVLSIEQYLDRADIRAFWDFTVPQVLKLSLLLLCERAERPVGIVFPLQARSFPSWQLDTTHLLMAGESLTGWLKSNEAFYALFTPGPFFQYAHEHRLDLFNLDNNDDILRVYPRHLYPLPFPDTRSQKIVGRMLRWLRQQTVDPAFDLAMRRRSLSAFLPFQVYDDSLPGTIFNHLANMVVQLGGSLPSGEPRWHFSCILLPKDEDILLPFHQRQLLVYAQSPQSPHQIGQTYVSPNDTSLSISLRSLSSGYILYRPQVTENDITVHFSQVEQVQSVVSMVLRDERDLPQAVLYVGSQQPRAFNEEDQCLLRLVGKLIEEAFALTRTYRNSSRHLYEILTNPSLIDEFFEKFLSENNFLADLSSYFSSIRAGDEQTQKDVAHHQQSPQPKEKQIRPRLALVMIDLKNRPRLTAAYGDLAIRNLSSEIGQRIQGLISAHFSVSRPLYHLHGSRFCFFIRVDEHESVVSKIKNMWSELNSSYFVNILQTTLSQPIIPETKVALTDIRMCAVVASYHHQALETSSAQETNEALSLKMLGLLEHGLTQCGSYEQGALLSWTSEENRFNEEIS
jgi:hypothetical protein